MEDQTTDWHEMDDGTRWQVRYVASNEDVMVPWVDGPRNMVYVEYEGDEYQYIIDAEHGDVAPAIYIDTKRVPRSHLRDDVKQAIVNAVSLTTMPVVRWKGGELDNRGDDSDDDEGMPDDHMTCQMCGGDGTVEDTYLEAETVLTKNEGPTLKNEVRVCEGCGGKGHHLDPEAALSE